MTPLSQLELLPGGPPLPAGAHRAGPGEPVSTVRAREERPQAAQPQPAALRDHQAHASYAACSGECHPTVQVTCRSSLACKPACVYICDARLLDNVHT